VGEGKGGGGGGAVTPANGWLESKKTDRGIAEDLQRESTLKDSKWDSRLQQTTKGLVFG